MKIADAVELVFLVRGNIDLRRSLEDHSTREHILINSNINTTGTTQGCSCQESRWSLQRSGLQHGVDESHAVAQHESFGRRKKGQG